MKLFADRAWLAPGRPHVTLLSPFWGTNPESPLAPEAGRFEAYARDGAGFLEMTPLEAADCAVVPNDWIAGDPNDLARRAAEAALYAGKPAVIFFNHDSEEEIAVPNSLIFRTSFTRSRRRPNEYALPAWHEDFVERYFGGELPVRPRQDKPTVGYCGYAASAEATRAERVVAPLRRLRGGYRALKAVGLGINDHVGFRLRSEAVARLCESARITTNFRLRQAFWNGALNGPPDAAFLQQTRWEFVENMASSDYVLCVRGAGNFSYRLYETLSCGRIPVFLDTDCVLPYEDWIDWRRYCVWVPEGELPRIVEHVAAFHESLTPAEFQERQRACRRLWEEWLSPTGFFANFYRHFS